MTVKEVDPKGYDIVLGLDKSGSEDTEDINGRPGVSRWNHQRETVEGFIKIAEKWDSDGPTIVFFDTDTRIFPNTTYANVASVFNTVRPGGGTNTAAYLHEIVQDYLNRRIISTGGLFSKKKALADPKIVKPLIVVTITDGQPTGGFGRWSDPEDAVAGVIVDAAKQIKAAGGDRLDLAFSFLRVGNDQHAADFLERLNDKLTSGSANVPAAPFDCVNCMDLDEVESFEEIIIKALTE
jgi:hypothetical protein